MTDLSQSDSPLVRVCDNCGRTEDQPGDCPSDKTGIHSYACGSVRTGGSISAVSEPTRYTATWGDALNGEPSGGPLPVREDYITDADLLAMSSTIDGRKKSWPLSDHDERVARACCEAVLREGRRYGVLAR